MVFEVFLGLEKAYRDDALVYCGSQEHPKGFQ
jgi:hypothetical protein